MSESSFLSGAALTVTVTAVPVSVAEVQLQLLMGQVRFQFAPKHLMLCSSVAEMEVVYSMSKAQTQRRPTD